MEDISGAYPLFLGGPWLCQAKVKQNWENNTISLCQGKKNARLCVHTSTMANSPLQPKYTEGINMTEGVDDSEEEQYLSKNESLVGLFEIDVACLLETYKSQEFVD